MGHDRRQHRETRRSRTATCGPARSSRARTARRRPCLALAQQPALCRPGDYGTHPDTLSPRWRQASKAQGTCRNESRRAKRSTAFAASMQCGRLSIYGRSPAPDSKRMSNVRGAGRSCAGGHAAAARPSASAQRLRPPVLVMTVLRSRAPRRRRRRSRRRRRPSVPGKRASAGRRSNVPLSVGCGASERGAEGDGWDRRLRAYASTNRSNTSLSAYPNTSER